MNRNNRNLLIMGGALVIMVGLYFLSNRTRSNLDETGGFVEIVEGQLSTAEVFGLQIYKGEPSNGFQLAKRGEDWVLTSHYDAPANENKLRSLLGNLESASAEVRSSSESVLADYALEDSTALHLLIKDESGAEMLHLLVGERSGPGGFVRREGSSEALRADHNFLADFGVFGEEITVPQATTWMDLVAFSAQRDSVESIELSWTDGRLRMAKEFAAADAPDSNAAPAEPQQYEWRVSEPSNFMAKKTTADGILGSVCSVRARDVAGRFDASIAGEWGLGEAASRATVHLSNGESKTLLFGSDLEDDAEQLYFHVEGDDLVWILPGYLRGNVFKDPGTLKPE